MDRIDKSVLLYWKKQKGEDHENHKYSTITSR